MRGFRKAFYVVLYAVILVDPIFFSESWGQRDKFVSMEDLGGQRPLFDMFTFQGNASFLRLLILFV